jgi:DHA1 family inner membrane transport protein
VLVRPALSVSALALGGFGIGTTEFATMGVLPDIAHNLRTSIPRGGTSHLALRARRRHRRAAVRRYRCPHTSQEFARRPTYLAVAVVGAITVAAVLRWVPAAPVPDGAGIQRELGALRRVQVWFALLTGAIGFGGFFAVYSYIAPTMTGVTGLSRHAISFMLVIFGLGMTAGNLVAGRLTDRSAVHAVYAALASVIIVLAVFTVTVHHAVLAIPTVFLLGATGMAAVPALQTRLMDVAADAQSLAAALNHSALNVANALGAWLGGLVVSAGYGYPSTAWAGVALAGGGLVVAVTSGRADRRAVPRGRVAASPASI